MSYDFTATKRKKDERGRVVFEQDKFGSTIKYSYGEDGGKEVEYFNAGIIEAKTGQVHMAYRIAGKPGDKTKRRGDTFGIESYDKHGNMIYMKNWGEVCVGPDDFKQVDFSVNQKFNEDNELIHSIDNKGKEKHWNIKEPSPEQIAHFILDCQILIKASKRVKKREAFLIHGEHDIPEEEVEEELNNKEYIDLEEEIQELAMGLFNVH